MCLWAFSQAAFQVIFWALWSMAPPSRTFLKGITTGVFMMKISGFWDRPLLLPFNGIPFIGSFGFHSQSQVSAKRAQTFASTGNLMPSLRMPWGFCFTYHRGSDCMGSSFRDDCFKCKGSHHALNSNFRAKIGGIQSQNSSQYAPLGTRSVIGWY